MATLRSKAQPRSVSVSMSTSTSHRPSFHRSPFCRLSYFDTKRHLGIEMSEAFSHGTENCLRYSMIRQAGCHQVDFHLLQDEDRVRSTLVNFEVNFHRRRLYMQAETYREHHGIAAMQYRVFPFLRCIVCSVRLPLNWRPAVAVMPAGRR